jgi:hypothetical protein
LIRRLIALALLVAVVAASLPGAVGLYLQHRHQRLLDHLGEGGYRILTREYRLGWLASESTTEIAPPAEAAGDESRLRVALRLRHGPTVWLANWPPPLARAAGRATLLGGPRALPPLVFTGTLSLTGGVEAGLRVPDVTYSGEAGQLHFVAGRAQLRLHEGVLDKVSGSLQALEATSPDGRKLRLDGIGWDLALTEPAAAVPIGSLVLSLDGLALDATEAQPPLALRGLTLTLTTEREGERAGLQLLGAVEALTLGDDAYAPSRVGLSLAGIDAPALQALRIRFAALDQQALTASQRGMVTGRLLLSALPQLLSGMPHAQLRPLSLTTPHGPLDAEADVRLMAAGEPSTVGAAPASPGTVAPADPLRTLAGRLTGSARVVSPQSLVVALIAAQQVERVRRELALRGEPVETLPPTLAAELDLAAQSSTRALLRTGWLKEEQGRLAAEIRLQDGTLAVNGKPAALPGWFEQPAARTAPR